MPLAAEPFDLAEVSFPRVDQTGCAKVRTNSYSVPLKPGSIGSAFGWRRCSKAWKLDRRKAQMSPTTGK
jgi:hypothetical protein